MKAMLTAAGFGERMQPLTKTTPKPLLTIDDKPLIVYHLEALKQAGIQDIVINTHHLANSIREALGSGEKCGVNLHYSHEDSLLGTGGGLFQALPLLNHEPFIIAAADLWTDYPYERLVNHTNLQHAHLVLIDNPPWHPQGDFDLGKHKQVCLSQSPKLAFSGIGVYHPNLFAGCQPGTFPIGPLLQRAIKAKQVTGERYEGVLLNIGTPEQLAALQASRKDDS